MFPVSCGVCESGFYLVMDRVSARIPPAEHADVVYGIVVGLPQVSQFVASAEAQLKAGDYAAAVRTVDAGMRLDAGNRDLQAVLDRAKPKFEAAERSRRSGLTTTELLKEKGDDFYKKASFEVSQSVNEPPPPPARHCCDSAILEKVPCCRVRLMTASAVYFVGFVRAILFDTNILIPIYVCICMPLHVCCLLCCG